MTVNAVFPGAQMRADCTSLARIRDAAFIDGGLCRS
jgi:hypothetical protein